MPWVYTLYLAEPVSASIVQNDWENNIPGNAKVQNDHGGVTITGSVGVIVSQRNNPDYQEMSTFSYVSSITEEKEIPSRGDSEFEPPIELGHSIELRE